MSNCSVLKTPREKVRENLGREGDTAMQTWANTDCSLDTGKTEDLSLQGAPGVSLLTAACPVNSTQCIHNTDSHQSLWCLELQQQKEWDEAEGQEATSSVCRKDDLSWCRGKISTFNSRGISEGAALRGGCDGWAGQSSSARLFCCHQKGLIHQPHAEDGWCLLPFHGIALLSCAFLPCMPLQTFR